MKSFISRTPLGLASALLFAVAACGPSDPAGTDDVDTPELESFEAQPGAITSGMDFEGSEVQGEVELSWETSDAGSIELYAGHEPLDLEECSPQGEAEDCVDGGTLLHEPDEATSYRIEVLHPDTGTCRFNDDGEVQNDRFCVSSTVDVDVLAPAILSFERDDDRFQAGEDFTVSYSVEHAEEWQIGILRDGDFESCETAACSVDGDQEGEITIEGGEERITLSGWANNGADDGLGDIEAGDVTMEFTPLGVPIVHHFDADPGHVAFGGSTTLSWETEEVEEIEVDSDANIYVESDLSECSEIDGDGMGSCEIVLAEDAPETTLTFTLTGFGEDISQSDSTQATVVLGASPTIDSFEADPSMLPEDGGDVTLSWETGSEPDHLVITANSDTILDTDDATGTDLCESSGDDCDFAADSIVVEDITENTQFTLTASSLLGSDSSSRNVTIEGAPVITELMVDGQDAFDDAVIVDTNSADFDWVSDNADEGTELQRGPTPDGGCDSSDVSWEEVADFPGSESGSYQLSELDHYEECFELTALGEAGQSASATFHVARHPEIAQFDADPQTATTGDDIELSWETPFADEVQVEASPASAASSNDLDNCTEVDANDMGSCHVTIEPGTTASEVTFSLVAIGFESSESDESEVIVGIGTAPVLDSFEADPASTDEDLIDVVLSWTATDGTELSIEDGTGVIHFTNDLGEISDGSYTVEDVDATTTWTVEVSNQFGSDSSDATTFFGPAVNAFDINGEDGLSGNVEVATGDVDFDWTTENADDSELERADVPGSADCSQVVDWQTVTTVTAGDGFHTETDVNENGCYRLSLSNAAGQQSSVTVLVRDVPFVTLIGTTPDSFDGTNGANVGIDISLVGATEFEVIARYFDEDDNQVDDTTVCDEDDASGDALDGSVDEKDVSCVHQMAGEQCTILGCSYDPDQDTDHIRYEVVIGDDDGEGATSDSDEYGEDVQVTWQ